MADHFVYRFKVVREAASVVLRIMCRDDDDAVSMYEEMMTRASEGELVIRIPNATNLREI